MKLRSKFTIYFALLTAGLTFATLLVVRRTAEARVSLELKQEALNALLTFRVLENQHKLALARKADLLASLAVLRNGEPTAFDEVSDDPWQSEECDLLALADPSGKIIAVHARMSIFPIAVAQQMFDLSSKRTQRSEWWYSGTKLYQVVIQPSYDGPETKKNLVGTVIVGVGAVKAGAATAAMKETGC